MKYKNVLLVAGLFVADVFAADLEVDTMSQEELKSFFRDIKGARKGLDRAEKLVKEAAKRFGGFELEDGQHPIEVNDSDQEELSQKQVRESKNGKRTIPIGFDAQVAAIEGTRNRKKTKLYKPEQQLRSDAHLTREQQDLALRRKQRLEQRIEKKLKEISSNGQEISEELRMQVVRTAREETKAHRAALKAAALKREAKKARKLLQNAGSKKVA